MSEAKAAASEASNMVRMHEAHFRSTLPSRLVVTLHNFSMMQRGIHETEMTKKAPVIPETVVDESSSASKYSSTSKEV
jgi:hypothetical protein